MSNIISFQFESQPLRVVDHEGTAWFVAKDVATALGYSNTNKAVGDHCKRAKSLIDLGVTIRDPQQNQELTLDPQTKLIPESDVYRLTMRSKLESAVVFQDWVVEEVLPSIRKTGGYQTKQMSPAEILIYQGQLMLAIEQEQLRQAEAQRLLEQRQDATEQRLDQIETATDHFTILGWHRYTDQQGSLTLPEAAQMGRKATKYCKDHDVPLGQVPDPRFGVANTYPKWVLDHLFLPVATVH